MPSCCYGATRSFCFFYMSDEVTQAVSTPRVVIATTVALSFISLWRAAAIVLSDLASSMFYAGGITEQAIGQSAPWFVLFVMFFSFAVRSIYMESCSMYVRGGVYVVVRDSMGGLMAKLSVSALTFDYLLTGPISAVSAGHYVGRLWNEIVESSGIGVQVAPNTFAVVFAIAITLYFWWNNIKGIQESSSKALRIMQITTVMVVILLIWGPLTLMIRGGTHLPPAPVLANLHFNETSLGWFEGTFWPQIASVAFFIAFGHAFLSMSGFETLAQVYRELAFPKLPNLKRMANLVCVYAVISTGLITLLASLIIPDGVRLSYLNNLIGGLVMNLEGPLLLKLIFHGFVVMVGALILSGAVNTSMIGANAVLNRVAEDGVLHPWFRKPQARFGTTYRIISMFALLQLVTICASGGDVYLLGEAYAFGVVWSFCLKSLGVLVLRFQRNDQEYKTPLNFRIRGVEVPLGLGITTLLLFLVAIANLISKQHATVYGLAFTLAFFTLFLISERMGGKKELAKTGGALEEFNLDFQKDIARSDLEIRPGSILIAVRDYNALGQLEWALERSRDRRRRDLVVMTIRALSERGGEYDLTDEQYFASYEKRLFTRVVEMAEKAGKHVDLLVIPAVNPIDGMVQTATKLKCSTLVLGSSPRMTSDELARRIGVSWESMPEPRHPLSLTIVGKDSEAVNVVLGPHAPRLWPEDVARVHEMWLDLVGHEGFDAGLHHRDVVNLALRRLEQDLATEDRTQVLEELREKQRRMLAAYTRTFGEG